MIGTEEDDWMPSDIPPDRWRDRKHGYCKTGTPEYHSWANMRYRCNKTTSAGYELYGGRGIKVCARWNDFMTFLNDMGPRPTLGHSLDRINVNGDYEPSNCRWATAVEQNNNLRRNVWVGNKTHSQLARELGVTPTCIRHRIKNGLDPMAPARAHAKRGVSQWNSKLTEEQILDIRNQSAANPGRSGVGIRLANKYKVSRAAISNVIHCKTWAHTK